MKWRSSIEEDESSQDEEPRTFDTSTTARSPAAEPGVTGRAFERTCEVVWLVLDFVARFVRVFALLGFVASVTLLRRYVG